MSYAESRDLAQLRRLEAATLAFVERWQSKPPSTSRRTLFLFPGGMGSKLYRATRPYNDNGPPLQSFNFRLNWVTLGSMLPFGNSALELEMHEVGSTFRDKDDRIVIADGSAELFCVDPYEAWRDWCDDRDVDWFTFGWDWRRPVEEAAKLFVERFLPVFQTKVQMLTGADPLANWAVLGHSQGGMVVNSMLRRPVLPGTLTAAIAICTPFYGYSGQIHRWCEGDSYFQLLDRMDVIRTISSFHGLYVLPFLDRATFERDRQQLGAPLDYPLSTYPSVDFTTASLPVDPFDPGIDRYPTGTGFDTAALAAGLVSFTALASPLTTHNGIFVAVRGVTTDSSGTPLLETLGGIRWGRIAAGPYDPDDSPIHDDAVLVPGDGTQPAWTTLLLGSRGETLEGPDIEHAFILEQPEALALLGQLLNLPAQLTASMQMSTFSQGPEQEQPPEPPREPRPEREPLPDAEDLDAVFKEIERVRLINGGKLDEREVVRVLEQKSLKELRGLARRFLTDLHKPAAARFRNRKRDKPPEQAS